MGGAVVRLLLHFAAYFGLYGWCGGPRLAALVLWPSPSKPDSSKRRFQREIVGAVVCRICLIAAYVHPSARARISRARNTSPAGKLRDCPHRLSSSRCSVVIESNSRYRATRHRRCGPFSCNVFSGTFH